MYLCALVFVSLGYIPGMELLGQKKVDVFKIWIVEANCLPKDVLLHSKGQRMTASMAMQASYLGFIKHFHVFI